MAGNHVQSVRMDDALFNAVEKAADEDRRSKSHELVYLIELGLKARDAIRRNERSALDRMADAEREASGGI